MTTSPAQPDAAPTDNVDRYLDLLAKALTRYGMDSDIRPLRSFTRGKSLQKAVGATQRLLARKGLTIARVAPVDYAEREVGQDVPVLAETSVGLKRLQNVRECIEQVLADDVPGDFLEAGVWRGGTVIFMKGVLAAHGERRTVWAADSFQGMPTPDVEQFPADHDQWLHLVEELSVSRERVEAALEGYGLLDEDVRFLEGWFKDTLPSAPINQLSVLRLDGDMYESTIQVLDALYDKVSPGGFIIVDDYGCFEACAKAVDDFRSKRGIVDPIVTVDWTGVYWRRSQ